MCGYRNSTPNNHLKCDQECYRNQEGLQSNWSENTPIWLHCNHGIDRHRSNLIFRDRILFRKKEKERLKTCGDHESDRF